MRSGFLLPVKSRNNYEKWFSPSLSSHTYSPPKNKWSVSQSKRFVDMNNLLTYISSQEFSRQTLSMFALISWKHQLRYSLLEIEFIYRQVKRQGGGETEWWGRKKSDFMHGDFFSKIRVERVIRIWNHRLFYTFSKTLFVQIFVRTKHIKLPSSAAAR